MSPAIYWLRPLMMRSRYLLAFITLPLFPGEVARQATPASARTDSRASPYASRPDLGSRDSIRDPQELARLARAADLFANGAPAAYRALAEKLGPGARDAYISALRRGLVTSLRDGDAQNEAWFRNKLQESGDPLGSGLAHARGASRGTVAVPGGLAAAALISGGRTDVSADRFLEELCRRGLRLYMPQKKAMWEDWGERVAAYFNLISSLKRHGSEAGGRWTVRLSTGTEAERKRSEQVLELLGWTLKKSGDGWKAEPATNGSGARRQEAVTALAIDEIAMAEAISSAKPFTLEIEDEHAAVYPAPELWKKAFFPGQEPAGGLTAVLARDVRLARLYVGLNSMDREAAETLVAAIPLTKLAEEYSERLFRYGSALAVVDGRVAVPGGVAAQKRWADLVNADPAKPAAFFTALLRRDDGRMLEWFYSLAQLDAVHQAFFTRNSTRLVSFYVQFGSTPEQREGGQKESAFIDFLRDVPLNDDGTVHFPGSPDVWMVVKGQSNSAKGTAKMLRKVRRTAAPDEEDRILVRLAKTRYEEGRSERSELDNFISVSRIEQARSEPLDEAEAVLLAQNFARYESFYPYFALFTRLRLPDYERFFEFGTKLNALEGLDAVNTAGQFHAVVEIISLLERSGSLSQEQAAEAFRATLQEFSAAADKAGWTAAALHSIGRILQSASPLHRGNHSDRLRDALVPAMPRARFVHSGQEHDIDVGAARRRNYARVLEAQAVPSLDALLAIDAELHAAIQTGTVSEQAVRALETSARRLTAVPLPENADFGYDMIDVVSQFRPQRLTEAIRKLGRLRTKKKVSIKALESLRHETLETIQSEVTAALAGVVYAMYFDEKDLPLSDPLLVRKHLFVRYKNLGGKDESAFRRSYFEQSGQGWGSFFLGSFVGFSEAAGISVAMTATGGEPAARPFAAAQIAAVRATDWRTWSDADQHCFALTVRAGREFMVGSASDSSLRGALAEATRGLLPLARRAGVLRAVDDRDWAGVWQSVTLIDTYFLGRATSGIPKASTVDSPVSEELRARRCDAAIPHVVGTVPFHIRESLRPMLIPLPPYEEFTRYLMPWRLAERAAEAKASVAYAMDRAGLPAAAAAALMEPVVRKLTSAMHAADTRDWRGALTAWDSVDDSVLAGALQAR